MDKQSSDGSCSFMQTKRWDGCSGKWKSANEQKKGEQQPLRFSFSLFLRVSSWWETKRDKSYKTELRWRHILSCRIKPSAVDAITFNNSKNIMCARPWPDFWGVLGLPTSLCWIRAARGDSLETCLVLYSPYLSVFALKLPPQYTQLLLCDRGQKKGLACFPSDPTTNPHLLTTNKPQHRA